MKSIHNAAPLLFKNISRIEANCFVFFIALIMQALIEREVRVHMQQDGTDALPIYPEQRDADRPTTNKIFDLFEPLSTYSIIDDGNIVEEFKDDLNDIQNSILSYLNVRENSFWVAA